MFELDCGVGIDDDVIRIFCLLSAEIVGLNKYHDHVAMVALLTYFFGIGSSECANSFAELIDFGVHFFKLSRGGNFFLFFGYF